MMIAEGNGVTRATRNPSCARSVLTFAEDPDFNSHRRATFESHHAETLPAQPTTKPYPSVKDSQLLFFLYLRFLYMRNWAPCVCSGPYVIAWNGALPVGGDPTPTQHTHTNGTALRPRGMPLGLGAGGVPTFE